MADRILTTSLFRDARAFLSELDRNNSRAWFGAQKTRYDAELKRPSERLLDDVARWLSSELGTWPRTKLFRPHRDVRFSEDKRPFHPHLHMMWSLSDGRAWMLGISPDYATLGSGVMGFSPDQLKRFRAALLGPEGDRLDALLEDGWRLDPPTLDTVPEGWPANHPREAHLRRLGLVAWADGLDDRLADDPAATLQAEMTRSAPLMDWLARVT